MRSHLRLPLLLAIAAAACSDPNELAPPDVPNLVDTVELYAIEGTSRDLPSAFTVGPRRPHAVKSDEVENLFDFVFNVDTAGGGAEPLFLTLGALGLDLGSSAPGIQVSEEPFDSLVDPPNTGFNTDSAVAVTVGTTYVVRSRTSVCASSGLGVPMYAKIRPLGLTDSSITLQVLANQNCGYRDLNPGIPER
jgi:hypothetical protein